MFHFILRYFGRLVLSLLELGSGMQLLVGGLSLAHELPLHEEARPVELVAHDALALPPHQHIPDLV